MTSVIGSLSLEVEGDPTTVGRMLVVGIMEELAAKMSPDQVTDCMLGMISACAGLIAVTYGPDVANKVLKRLPEISAEAMKDNQGARH